MLNLLKVSLVTLGIISNASGSTSTDPFANGNESAPQSEQKEPVRTTQDFLEDMLREQGALKPGQHLAPHEVWRLADFLKARINARRVLQAR